jgi:hypothetical protein
LALANIALAGIVAYHFFPALFANKTTPSRAKAASSEQDWALQMEDMKDLFHRPKVPVNQETLKSLAARKIVPPEWAEGNFVPYYDPEKEVKTKSRKFQK